MFNKEEFINKFVEAAANNDEEKMKELSEQAGEVEGTDRITLLEGIVDKLKETKANSAVEEGLAATLALVKMAAEANENSTAQEAKDTSKAEEATQDVAAEGSAAEAETPAPNADISQGEAEGEAPAEEEKTEKSEEVK